MARRTVALAVVALALGWRLIAALSGAALELARPDSRGRPLVARFAAFDEPLAARRHRALGSADAIFAAVARRVPEDAVLVVRLHRTQRDEYFSMALIDLLWPRRIVVTEGDPLAGLPPDARTAGQLFALLLADEAPLDPAAWEPVESVPRYSLWRATGTRR